MAEEFQQAALCGGANYFWWNNTTPSATTADVADSAGLVLNSSFGDWNQQPHNNNNHLPRGGESNFNSMLQEDTTTSISHNNSYSDETSLLKTLFEPDSHHQDGSISVFNNARLNELSPFLQQQEASFNFTNNTPFWNATTGPALSDHNNIISNNNINGANFFPSQSQLILAAPNSPKLFPTKTKAEEVRDSATVSVKKGNSGNNIIEPAVKRPRIETPSPLPTFKVRKEKLGDRITALQQLVSPFGKTDTASVLHEAIEYIKFLHDQVLSTPYMKIGAPLQHHQPPSHHDHHHHHHKQRKDETETGGEAKQDLRSRGLCLVPISSTFPVANETTSDFWTPTFGATFR